MLGALAAAVSTADELERHCASPPDESRPWCYWWWRNGNASQKGITRDFEEVRKQGISGALLFDAGEAASVARGPAFMSTEWRELFKHAVREANRCGIVLTVNPCSGWNAGGPWVTPDHAAKKLVYAQSVANGGSVKAEGNTLVVAEVVIVVAGQKRKDQSPPEFAQVAGNVVAELPDRVGQERVSAGITWGEPQQAGPGEKGNANPAGSVKPGDDRHAVPAHRHQPVLDDANAGFRGECERQNFAAGNVPRIVGLGELGQGQPAIGQTDGRLRPGAAQR